MGMRRINSRRIILASGASILALGASGAFSAAWAADEANAVDELVVTGQRASIQSAQEIKKNAEQIVDSITAVDIGALPDRSVTEALQRIAGVTITRTPEPRDSDRISVEGSGVQVRGLSYVRSELNGRDSFSAKNGRSLSFDDVPSELMAGIDVYKNPSADMVEGGLGGTVNLRTRLPFDQPGRVIAYSLDGSYADLAKKWTPSGSVLFSDRWQTGAGEFGVLLDLSDSKFKSLTDTISVNPYFTRTDLVPGQTVFVPGGWGYRNLKFERERQGMAAAVQWQPDETVLVTAQFLRSAAYSSEQEHAVGFDPGATDGPAAGTTFTYDSQGRFVAGTIADQIGGTTTNPDVIDDRYNTKRSVTSDYSLNAKWTPNDKWAFNFDVQYIKAKTKALDFTLFDNMFQARPAATLDLRGDLPRVTMPDTAAFTSDPANYYWNAAMDFHAQNEADEWAERIDGAYTFDGDWLKSFRFGVRHTKRDAITRETPFNWGYITQTWAGAGVALANGTGPTAAGNTIQSAVEPFANFFRGDVHLPVHLVSGTDGFISNYASAVASILAAENRTASCCGPWTPFNGNYDALTAGGGGGGTNNQSEETWAAFGLLRFGHDLTFGDRVIPMDGNIGLRLVSSKAHGAGSQVFSANGIVSTSPDPTLNFPASDIAFANGARSVISGGRSYTDPLPSLNLRFELSPELFIRFAAAQSIVRPDFTQMQPTITIGATGGYINPTGCLQTRPPTDPSTTSPTNCVYQYTAFEGNPTLNPVKATQFDLAAEWYFAKAGSLTATVFSKDVFDFITTDVTNQSFTNNGVTKTVRVTQPVNAGHGQIRGFELTYQQYFDFLPGPLAGVGVQANYTYINSKGARNAAADPYDSTQVQNALNQVELPLEGLSKTSYNVALLYDWGPVSARLAYNWREKYLMTTSAANINIPSWTGDYGQLDASVFYTISPKVKVGVEAANITDQRTEIFVSYPITPNPGLTGHNWVDADRRISVALRGQF
ncbi:MAG: TonB-dependent receptor [Phenylobacterium sp.]